MEFKAFLDQVTIFTFFKYNFVPNVFLIVANECHYTSLHCTIAVYT